MSREEFNGVFVIGYDRGYQQGRADAIEEFSEEIEYSFKLNGGIVIEDIERLAEQLKEQNK